MDVPMKEKEINKNEPNKISSSEKSILQRYGLLKQDSKDERHRTINELYKIRYNSKFR